jgi:hypothetical protein
MKEVIMGLLKSREIKNVLEIKVHPAMFDQEDVAVEPVQPWPTGYQGQRSIG